MAIFPFTTIRVGYHMSTVYVYIQFAIATCMIKEELHFIPVVKYKYGASQLNTPLSACSLDKHLSRYVSKNTPFLMLHLNKKMLPI